MKTRLIVLLTVALLCLALSRLRLGGKAAFGEDGLRLQIRVGPFFFRVFPPSGGSAEEKPRKKRRKKRKKRRQPPKRAKKSPAKQPKKKKSRALRERLDKVLPFLYDHLSELLRLLGYVLAQIRVDELYLRYIIAGQADPAAAALLYGRLCAAGSALEALLPHPRNIHRRELRLWVDFTAAHAEVELRLALSVTVGQIVCITVKLLTALWKMKRESVSPSEKHAGS